MFNKLISIVIPTFNERGNIVNLINSISSILGKISYEIIIVDDNSSDGTSKIIKQFFKKDKKIRLFVRKKKKGLGTAIVYGIKKSKGKIIVGMDADFNHPPEKILQLISILKTSDLVVASRFIDKGGMEDKIRYFFTYIFNLFLKYFLGFPTMDNMSGFYAIKKSMLKKLPIDLIYQGYGEYFLRLIWYAKKNNFKIKEIPVFYQERKYGKSKSNLIKMFFKYFYVVFRLKLNYE